MSDADEQEVAAATKIQAMQRGREDRARVAQMKKENEAAIKIQARQRGREDRARVQAMRDEAKVENPPPNEDGGEGEVEQEEEEKKEKKKKKRRKKRRKKRKRIGVLLIGPPGAGKTEQAKRIGDKYEAVLLGTVDDVLSWAVAEGLDFAGSISEARESNSTVAPNLIAQALGERLACPDIKDSVAWTLEGFPSVLEELDEFITLAGEKLPASHTIALNADADTLKERVASSDKDDKPDNDSVDAALEAFEQNITDIQQRVESMDAKFQMFADASEDADGIFEAIRTFLGPSAEEDAAAERIQAQVRGREARAKMKKREEAAVRIQAQIRGKEARMHAKRRKDIKASHDEDEILTSLTAAASGPEGRRIQNCFPRKRQKDIEISTLLKKLNRIKSKDETVEALKGILDRPKVVELLHRDFKRENKKGEPVINYEEFESMVNEHGGKMEERKEMLTSQMIEAIQREFELRPGAFRELFEDMDVDDSGGVDLDEFRDSFADRAELWGYAEAFSAERTKEMGLFEAIDDNNDNIISWDEFEAYFLAEKNKRETTLAKEAAKIQEAARSVDREKELAEAVSQREKVDEGYETDEECELEDLRKASRRNVDNIGLDGGSESSNTRRRQMPRSRVRVADSATINNQAARSSRNAYPKRDRSRNTVRTQRQEANTGQRFAPAAPEEPDNDRPPMGTPDRKIMLVKILRKYRRGLHTAFEFYCKANAGTVRQKTFDQMREEHGGVNLLMFRRMCKDFNLTHDPRAKFNPKSKAVDEMIRPYITKEEIDAIFKRHAQHLKRVSSISHGKGILNEAQFAAAFAQIAVVLLREEPWCERYPEEWRRVDAIFSRLDVNNNVLLRKRLRGFGGFSKGDGDISSRAGDRPTVMRTRGFSFNLRLPGDPITPPPESSRPKRNRMVEQKPRDIDPDLDEDPTDLAVQAAENDDTKMTVSLAAEFGIDDSTANLSGGSNPYGTTSSAQYGDVTSMLDNLGLTYGLDSSRLGKSGGNGSGDMMWAGTEGMESMSWGDLDGTGGSSGPDLRRKRSNRRSPKRPSGAKPARLQQTQSPRLRR